MDVLIVFTIFAFVLIIGFLSELFFQKTGIPDVLIMIVIGLALRYIFKINPEMFGDAAVLFTTFALLYILFQGAMKINFSSLMQTMNETLRLTVLSFVLSVAVTTTILTIFNYPLFSSIAMGTIVGGISSIVIIPIINKIDSDSKLKSTLTLESAISDVLCIVGTVAVINIVISTENGVTVAASQIFRDILILFSLGLVIGLVAGFGWISLLNKIKWLGHENLLTIAVILLLYSFVESPFVKASGAIAVLAFGLVVGNSKKILEKIDKEHSPKLFNNSALTIFTEISFFLKVIFFVYLGIVLDLSDWRLVLVGAIITAMLFIVRPIAVFLSFNKLEANDKYIQDILIPRGLAAAVLAQFAVIQFATIQVDVSALTDIAFAVIFFSIVASSMLIFKQQHAEHKVTSNSKAL